MNFPKAEAWLFAAVSGDLRNKLKRNAALRAKKSEPSTPRRKIRIAFGRIQQEINALSPVATTVATFEATHLLEGQALRDAIEPGAVEIKGFMSHAELSGLAEGARLEAARLGLEVEFIPLMSALTVPSGCITRESFDELTARITTPLAQAHAQEPIDAVFMSMHGSMGVFDLPLPDSESPDSEVIRRIREVVGPDAFVGVTLDLHGNLCAGLVERTTMLQAYRTNPHRDHVAVGVRVGRVLVRTVTGEIKPVQRWCSLPMILGGGMTIDFLNPLRPIFQRMNALDADPRVLGASLFNSHPWNHHRELGWSTLVVTDGEPELAQTLAEELADATWKVREVSPPRFISAVEAVKRTRNARTRALGPLIATDLSDVVSAGAPGENTRILSAVLEEGQDVALFFPIRDPELIEDLWTNHQVGDHVTVTLGAKLDPAHGQAIEVSGQIAGMPESLGVKRMVVLAVGKSKIVITEGPAFAIRPAFYENAGLRVRDADLIVAKSFFPFLMFFFPYTLRPLFVKTQGVTDLDAAFGLDFAGPFHPRDPVDEWRPTDKRRHQIPLGTKAP